MNVCTWTSPPGRSWEIQPVTGGPLTELWKGKVKERSARVLANSEYVHGSVAGAFANGIFSVNEKHKLAAKKFAQTVSAGSGQYTVYTGDGTLSSAERALLARPEALSLIAQAALKDGESLYFTAGDMGFDLKRPLQIDRLVELLTQLAELAESVEIVEERPKYELLPTQFHPLIPLIEKWAVADDLERREVQEVTPARVLRSVIGNVSPHLQAINAFLDSFGESEPTDEANIFRQIGGICRGGQTAS